MSKVKLVLILILIGSTVARPGGLNGEGRAIADAPSLLLEVTASPIGDPDPRDDTSIAVSPKNEQVIVGASKVIQGVGPSGQGNSRVAYYFSSNGGLTWGSGLAALETPQKTWGRASDASVAADLDGNFYLCVRMADNSNFDTGVYVFKSTDDGRTFTTPAPVVFDIGNLVNPIQAGKCRVTVDASTTSQFKGTVYVVWTSSGIDVNGQNSTVVRFARRRPADASFTVPKSIGHQGDMRGPTLVTGPNGEFYAAWVGMPARSLLFNASTDGGDSFLPGLASIDITVHNYVGSLEGPNQSFFIDGVPRANSFPTIDVDRSSGPNRGIVYVAWAETTNGRDTDIFLRRISPRPGTLPDIGPAVKVNRDGSAADQFFPCLSVDASSGAVEVAFYDRRDSPGLMNLYLARSTDGSATFGETRISSTSSDPRIQASVAGIGSSAIGIGDYVGLVAIRGKAHMLWTDTRRGKQEIFFGQFAFDSSVPPVPPIGLAGDNCQSPRVISTFPFLETLDTRGATSASDDPLSCTGGSDTNTVWYAFTPATNTVYGVETILSDYDTVLSIYTGVCGSLARVACSDDFGNPSDHGNRSALTFSATAGVTYLIEASGKGIGGSLKIRAGFPTITGVEYTSAPDGSDALKITGAGFVNGSASVTAQLDGEDVALPNMFFNNQPLPDGTDTTLFAWKKKLKKLVKRGSLLVRIESPAGSGNISNMFLFTR